MTYSPPWIEITTNFPCPNRCEYCPQDVTISVYKGDKQLSIEKFKQVLTNVPKNVMIDFAGFSEPFVNPECADMMVYANEQGYKIGVWTTLVGCKDEDAKKIKDIPFVWFHVHDIGQKKRNYPFILEWGKAIPNDRAGNLSKGTRKESVNGCARSNAYDTNVMMPNGDVVLCCSDWAMKHKLGNLLETNFNDLHREAHYELCNWCVYSR